MVNYFRMIDWDQCFSIQFKARTGHASATTAPVTTVTNVETVLLVGQPNDFINYSLGN